MGVILSSCCGEDFGPERNVHQFRAGNDHKELGLVDPEERRKQMAEAAERRMKAQNERGIHDTNSLQRRNERQAKIEQAEKERDMQGGYQTGGLRWQVG